MAENQHDEYDAGQAYTQPLNISKLLRLSEERLAFTPSMRVVTQTGYIGAGLKRVAIV